MTNNDSNFAIRLKLFMDALGLSSSQLADRCGIPRPSLSAILAGRNKKISDTLIGQIHSVFPQLSVLWLMFGEGDMLLAPYKEVTSSSDMSDSSNSPFSPEIADPVNNSGRSDDGSFHQSVDDIGVSFLSVSSNASKSRSHSSENLNLPSNPSGNYVRGNLSGLEKSEIEAQNVDNKGFDDDLRTIALMRQIENLKANPRKVTQITIYYDDSTFETFFPSRS